MVLTDGEELRIEHVYTGDSTVEPLPYLVDAQRRSDQQQGRNTWVLLGSETEEAFLINELRSIFRGRAQEEGNNDGNDGGRWGVRCTQDIDRLSPDEDCVMVTTTECAIVHLMAADGTTPTQFSNKMTFMIDLGWGNLTIKAAYAYDRLLKFVYNKKRSSHIICTISSDTIGPFNEDWVACRQNCCMTTSDGKPPRVKFWEDINQPLVAMDEMIEELQRINKSRAVILMEYKDALRLETIGNDLNERCHFISLEDTPMETFRGVSDTSKHVIANGGEMNYLGNIPGVTHVILYPFRQGLVWDRDTNQLAFQGRAVERSMAELRYAMSWRGRGRAPEIHYLATSELFDDLEEDPIDSMVYTSHFDNHVLSSLSVWSEFPVAKLPLRVGRNPDLTELRLRWLVCKGLLEVDQTRGPRRAPAELIRFHSHLKLTLFGRVVSELVNPYITAIDSVHAACLVGQLFAKMHRTSAAVVDAVCSLAVVLTSNQCVTHIDDVIKPKETFKSYTDNPESLASEHCHRGTIWLAVCVWHFTLTDDNWQAATNQTIRRTDEMRDSTRANGRTLVLWYRPTFEWEGVAARVKHVFTSCGVRVDYADAAHRLSPQEVLEVEDMLVTAFIDKLVFVYVPAREGPFGYSMTTLTELQRPSDEQMRLIDLEKCWEEDKAAVGHETAGIYCIFTHCRMIDAGGRAVPQPYDLTYVSTAAVRRALEIIDAPMVDRCLFSKIQTDYKLDL